MASGTTSLQQQFQSFARFGDFRSDGKTISLTNCDKWLRQAKIIDGKNITTTDTGICFNRMKSRILNFEKFLSFIEELADYKKVDSEDLISQLMECGIPTSTRATASMKSGAVDRLTDTSHYTGTHKQRFDKGGRGRGLAGRKDLVGVNKGYVTGYKNADTYDTN